MTAIPKLIGKLVCMHSTCDNKQHEFSMWMECRILQNSIESSCKQEENWTLYICN